MNGFDLGGGMPDLTRPQLDPTEYPNSTCECGCIVWNQAVILKEVPGSLIGKAGETVSLPLTVFVCNKCGKIHPEDIKAYRLTEKQEQPKTEQTGTLIV